MITLDEMGSQIAEEKTRLDALEGQGADVSDGRSKVETMQKIMDTIAEVDAVLAASSRGEKG